MRRAHVDRICFHGGGKDRRTKEIIKSKATFRYVYKQKFWSWLLPGGEVKKASGHNIATSMQNARLLSCLLVILFVFLSIRLIFPSVCSLIYTHDARICLARHTLNVGSVYMETRCPHQAGNPRRAILSFPGWLSQNLAFPVLRLLFMSSLVPGRWL